MNQTLTLGAIRDASPCGIDRNETRTGFRLLLHSLGEPDVGYNRDRRVSLGDVAVSNGANDAWWCVRALDTHPNPPVQWGERLRKLMEQTP